MITNYDKLVRDKIPNIIKSEYKKCKKIKIPKKLFCFYLHRKLEEEVAELEKAKKENNHEAILEELADVLEVLCFISKHGYYTPYSNNINISTIDFMLKYYDEIKQIQQQKRKEKGSFKKRILLLSVEE